MNAGYALVDESLCVWEISPGFCDLVGDVISGAQLDSFLPIVSGVQAVLRSDQPDCPPFWYVPAVAHQRPGEGHPRYLNLAVLPREEGDGFLVTVRDVTKEIQKERAKMQRRNEERLRRRGDESLLQSVFPDTASVLDLCAQLDLMFAVLSEDLVIRAATSSLTAYCGRVLVGHFLTDAIASLGGLEDELSQIAWGQAAPWRLSGLQLDEMHLRPCDVIFLPRADALGLVMAARPMAAEAAVEQTLRQQRNELALLQGQLEQQASALRTANDRLQSLDRERRGLVDLVAWDIRSALSVVLGYTEWLTQETTPAQQAMLGAVETSAQRVNALIQDVQALARIEEALVNIQWTSLSAPAVVERALAMRRDEFKARNIRLEAEQEGETPAIVGDAELLQEALDDVIRAALAGVEPDIIEHGATIVARVSGWERWVIVRFTEDKALALARPAAPAPRSDDLITKNQTSRLGLARARLIVEGHGGHLSVEEGKGRGHTVSLWLPAAGVHDISRYHTAPETVDTAGSEMPAAPASDLIVAGAGSIRINAGLQRVWVDDEPVKLATAEYYLLLHLARRRDQVVTHDQILTMLRSYGQEASLDTLRVLVWRLRQKLQSRNQETQNLRTVRGIGYVLIS